MPQLTPTMIFQKKDRSPLVAGTIFVMKYPNDQFLFGRIIRDDAKAGGFVENLLLYIYDEISEHREDVPALSPRKLLIPPLIMNRSGWREGYINNVLWKQLDPEDVRDKHFFWSLVKEKYFDEYNNEMEKPNEPYNYYGLADYLYLDKLIVVELKKRGRL